MTDYGSGSIERLPSGRFRVRVPDGTGGYAKLGTYATAKEAERMRVASLKLRASGAVVSKTETLTSYALRVIDRWRIAGKRDTDNDRSRWNTWIAARADFASQPLDLLSRSQVREWLRSLSTCRSARGRRASPLTLTRALVLLRTVLTEAVEDELIETNPAVGVRAPKSTDAQEDTWTALSLTEIHAVLECEALDLEQVTAFSLAIYTGLRQGELVALRWDDVRDLDGAAPHVVVRRSWDTTTKSRRTRRVDLIPAAAQAMRRWRDYADRSPSGCVWGTVYSEGYCWNWSDRRDYANGVCRLGFKRWAGIARRVTWHHLRDTCASHLLMGSWGHAWTVAKVAALLGHTSTWVTERYARVLPGALAEDARKTFHEPSTPSENSIVQASGIIQHARRDSNPRRSVPKTDALSS